MTKYKLKKYLTIIPFIVSFLIGCCIYDYWEFFNFLDTYPSVRLNDKAIFLNIAGGRNYLSEVNISVYYVIAFVLFLLYIFPPIKPSGFVRLKSRNSYITRRIADCSIFAFIFAFLIEAVNVTVAFICFDINIILSLNFIPYTLLELLTLFLFYFRAGLVFLAFEVIISRKVAPFITIAFYAVEYSADLAFMISQIWLPFRDAHVLLKLMTREIQPTDIFSILFRALVMALLLIASSYFLFNKKDVLSNAKK